MKLSLHPAPQLPYPCDGHPRRRGLCDLRVGGFDRSHIHYAQSNLALRAYVPLLVRSPSGNRPHVSLSAALPAAFASWGIPPTSYMRLAPAANISSPAHEVGYFVPDARFPSS